MNSVVNRTAFLLASCLYLWGCAPYQPVRPYENFIRTGVAPGDRVRIVKTDGAEVSTRVLSLQKKHLATEAGDIAMTEITTIARRGWTKSTPACGNGQPLGCSIPVAVDLLTERLDEAKDLFEPACTQHDFCYRHGAATYGHQREDCDREFKQLMEQACRDQHALEKISWATNPVSCKALAGQMHRAVRRYGEGRFVTNVNSYCEYDGPPAKVGR